MQVVVWTSEALGLKVPGEALVPYLDMIATWLKLKLDEVREATVDSAATTEKKPKPAAKALAKAKAQAKVAKANRLAEAEKARKALEA